MAKKNFLLLSLEDKKAKKVANVVSNDSCKKILDYLSENEGTESEIAKKLNIPLSTVHYNLGQLLDAGLIEADEYHYSEKGKEVFHYKLANKYIVIAPKSEKSNLAQKLRGILPVGLLALGVGFVIQFVNSYFSKESIVATNTFAGSALNQKAASAPAVAREAAEEGAIAEADGFNADSIEEAESMIADSDTAIESFGDDSAVMEAAESLPAPEPLTESMTQSTSFFPESIALWFFLGAVFSIIVYLFLNRKK